MANPTQRKLSDFGFLYHLLMVHGVDGKGIDQEAVGNGKKV